MNEQTASVTLDRYVSIMQACKVVGVSRRTIYNWLHAEKLQYTRTIGGRVRILEASLWQADAARSDGWKTRRDLKAGG